MRLRILLFSFLFVFIAMISPSAQTIPYGNNKKVGKYSRVNGIKLYYEIYGTGTPLLLIHGNGGSISSFAKTIPYFAQRYEVIAVDSRAQGKSTDSGDSLSFEMMADDFATLLDNLKIDSAFVLGWSDGGINALVLAMRHPGKVKRIALTGANIFSDPTAFAEGNYAQMQQYYEHDKDKPRTSPQDKNNWKLFMLDYLQPRLTFQSLQAVKCPAFVICGDKDAISIDHTVKIYQSIPTARLWVVPNSGHATLIEHTADFNKNVDGFFRGK